MSRRRRGLPVRRDGLLFVLGATGIGYQQITERYNLPMLILYGLMVGVPGLAQLILAARGLAAEVPPDEGGSTEPSSSPSPAPSSPSPS